MLISEESDLGSQESKPPSIWRAIRVARQI